jgi:O-antigen ligase
VTGDSNDARWDAATWAAAVASLVLVAGVVLTPALAGPGLARDRALVRAIAMLLEGSTVLAWSVSRDARLPRPGAVLVTVAATWGVAMVLSTAFAEHVAPAVVRTAEWFSHVTFGLVLASLLASRTVLPRVVASAGAVGFALTCALLIAAAFRMADPGAYDWARLPYIGHVRYLGIYAVFALVLAAWPLLEGRGATAARALSWGCVVLAWCVIWWSGGRAAILTAFGATVLLTWFAHGRRTSLALALGLAIVLGAAVSLLLPAEDLQRGINRGMGIHTFFGRVASTSDAYSTGRMELWATAVDAWSARPLLGVGPDAGAFVLSAFGHEQPHNVILQALLEWGVVGALPFLTLVALLAAAPFRDRGRKPLPGPRVVAGVAVVAAGAHALLDGVLYDPRWLALVAASGAIAVMPGPAVAPVSVTARRAATAGALLILLVAAAHLVTLGAVLRTGTPAPDSLRARWVRAFPSVEDLQVARRWARDWAASEPAEARRILTWGARHGSHPWTFLRDEAALVHAQGDRTEAGRLTARADALEAAALRHCTPVLVADCASATL